MCPALATLPIVPLPPLAHWTKLFQERPLLNRAVLDTVGYAIPSILLTRNPIERKEQTLDRALVIGSAFFLAPLHALLFLKLFGRNLPSQKLMWMPFQNLTNATTFRQGLKALAHEALQDSRGKVAWKIPKTLLTNRAYAEKVRKQVIQNKAHMLMVDMLTEAMIFTNIRFVTNWFTKRMTGKHQFSGEYGAVDQQRLDQFHEHQAKQERFTEHQKQLFNNGLAIVLPAVTALGLRKAFLKPNAKGPWLSLMRKVASSFDYNKGVYMGMGAMGLITAMQLLGYAMAARDRYELREKMIVQNIGNYIFFFGNWTWMQLLSKAFVNQHKLPAVRSIQGALTTVLKQGGTPQKAAQAAGRASMFYWLCFILNNLSFASLVVLTNKDTVKRLKSDVSAFEKTLQPNSANHAPKPLSSMNDAINRDSKQPLAIKPRSHQTVCGMA